MKRSPASILLSLYLGGRVYRTQPGLPSSSRGMQISPMTHLGRSSRCYCLPVGLLPLAVATRGTARNRGAREARTKFRRKTFDVCCAASAAPASYVHVWSARLPPGHSPLASRPNLPRTSKMTRFTWRMYGEGINDLDEWRSHLSAYCQFFHDDGDAVATS